jgi:pyrroline-5-carboxylate reductase
MRVAVIGTGAMGGAILTGLLEAGWDAGHLVAVDLSEERRTHFSDLGVATASNPSQLSACDVVVVATKPQHVLDAVEELNSLDFGGCACVLVSVAAGISTAAIEAVFVDKPVVRAMPNTPALVGAGMSAIAPGSLANCDHLARAEAVLGCVGQVVIVDESDIDAVTAVSGSGPAYAFFLAEAMEAAGVALGLDSDIARKIVTQTLLGAGTLLAQSRETATVLRERVTSPGGTTAAALATMREHNFEAIIYEAVVAAATRSKELGET